MPQQVAVGKYIYLHRPDRPFNAAEFHLLISAHGMVAPGEFTVPDWTNLHYYGKHGAAIYDPGFRNMIEGKYQVLESSMAGDQSHDYLLSKYQGRHGAEKETYAALQHAVRSNTTFLEGVHELMASQDERKTRMVRRAFDSRHFAFHFDVLTIRNRYKGWTAPLGVKLSWVLSELYKSGYRYEQIHCSFCRWRPWGGSVSAEDFGS